MTAPLDSQTLRRTHERLKRKVAEVEARRQAVLIRLEEEFGVKTVEDAAALLVKLRKKEVRAMEEDHAAKKRYEALLEEHREAVEAFLKEVGP